jgi:hypothetical protein
MVLRPCLTGVTWYVAALLTRLLQSFLTTPFVGRVSYLADPAAAKKAALRRPIRCVCSSLSCSQHSLTEKVARAIITKIIV